MNDSFEDWIDKCRTNPSSWKELLDFESDGDEIIYCTLSEDELLEEFDRGFGYLEGKPFTAWSNKYVYFPVCYDGSEYVAKVPRNPCSEVTEHVGDYGGLILND